MPEPRIGIHVVAYNAAGTLAWVLDRIPESFRPSIAAVLVSDDHSMDRTYEVGDEYRKLEPGLPITVVRQPRNLGYGGNQKFGYRWMIEQGIDFVVLLHGDGQYAPEELPTMVEPLLDGRADVVLGSRMLRTGEARRGGMPLYKYLGNRVLTAFQNRVAGLELSEWHSGYRAFSTAALARIPFAESSDGFDFDTEVLLQLREAGARIVEVPIPTYYGNEICHVNGIKYAWDVSTDVVRYRLGQIGFGTGTPVAGAETGVAGAALESSHRAILDLLAGAAPRKVLDLGCADGRLAAELRALGSAVVGVDVEPQPGVEERVDRFVRADLDVGLPSDLVLEAPFDLVLAADVLEHLKRPERLLDELHALCGPDATLVVSLPNFGHWYPRLRVAFGRFDYDRRGILDSGHLRFFSWRGFQRMARRAGWLVDHRAETGVPRLGDRLPGDLGRLDRLPRAVWPSLFAYQWVALLRPDPTRRLVRDLAARRVRAAQETA